MKILKPFRFLKANGSTTELLRNARAMGFATSTTCGQPSTNFLQASRSRSFSSSQDLKRFLKEVGTDPKEARYWLQQFQQRESRTDQPFAVVEISSDVFKDIDMLNKLASCLSFLNRNDMPVVVVHGVDPSTVDMASSPDVIKEQLLADNKKLVELLELNGSKARPFLCPDNVVHASSLSQNSRIGEIEDVDVQPLQWFLRSGHIPIVTAVGETSSGQKLCLDPSTTAMKVARILKPTKVVFLNTEGGLRDHNGEVVDTISIPTQVLPFLQKTQSDTASHDLITPISDMLLDMPSSTSAVITSGNSLITELFTHNGSGTLFQISEKINTYNSMSDVNTDELRDLLVRSFNKELSPDYFSTIEENLHTLYISESYTAAAIVTLPKETDGVPYLDKFTVSRDCQGQGTSDSLWRSLREDFEKLCWRSRGTNRINPWYFVRSNGCWVSGMWTVFWYGVTDQLQTIKLVKYANSLPSSFDPVAPHSEPCGKKHISTSAFHKYL